MLHSFPASRLFLLATMAWQLDPPSMNDTVRAFVFGNSTGGGFPGEASGYLRIGRDWRPLEKAILGYGYGLNVTVLQLANAYATIADGGVMHSPTFIKGNSDQGKQIIAPEVSAQLLRMMETVRTEEGRAGKGGVSTV